jgi:hypothetical protein
MTRERRLTLKTAIYLILLCGLGGVVWLYPFLFELFILGAIGGAYWIFFHEKTRKTD